MITSREAVLKRMRSKSTKGTGLKAKGGLIAKRSKKISPPIFYLPSGNSTLELLYDGLTLKQLEKIFKPIILYNQEVRSINEDGEQIDR